MIKLKNSLALILALTFSCQSLSAKSLENHIVARVNNKVITKYDLDDRYKFLRKYSEIKPTRGQERLALEARIIDKMIDEELILQKAKTHNINASPNEIKGAIEGFSSKKGLSYSSFKKSFRKNNVSFSNFRKQVQSDLVWSKIISGPLKSRIKITDLEIKEFLEQKNHETDITQYKIAEIFIPAKKNGKTLAKKLHRELLDGADFQDFVKQFSQSATAEIGGEIGFVSKGDIHQKIYQEISQLRKNNYSRPVFLSDGYYIFKLLDKKTSTEISDDDRKFARQRIFMQKLETKAKSYMMEIKKEAFIEIYI